VTMSPQRAVTIIVRGAVMAWPKRAELGVEV